MKSKRRPDGPAPDSGGERLQPGLSLGKGRPGREAVLVLGFGLIRGLGV